jgi:hypothetical protein
VSGVLLELNLQPWRASATLIAEIGSKADRVPISEVTSDWARTHPPGLVVRDGIPRSYQGAWIFENGYDEFRADAGRPPQ